MIGQEVIIFYILQSLTWNKVFLLNLVRKLWRTDKSNTFLRVMPPVQLLTFTYNIDMIDLESWSIIILSDENINSSGFSTDESMKYKSYKNEI